MYPLNPLSAATLTGRNRYSDQAIAYSAGIAAVQIASGAELAGYS